jgi:hypothetical protein
VKSHFHNKYMDQQRDTPNLVNGVTMQGKK